MQGTRSSPGNLRDGRLQTYKQTRNLLDLKMVPYFNQAELSKEGYVTTEDLADRWDTHELARQKAPEEFGFRPGDIGYTEATSKFSAMSPCTLR